MLSLQQAIVLIQQPARTPVLHATVLAQQTVLAVSHQNF